MNEAVAQQVAEQEAQRSKVVSKAAQMIVISTDTEYDQAAKMLLVLKEKIKVIDEKRQEFTKPLYDLQRKINAFFKQPINEYEEAAKQVKAAMSAYHMAKEAARRKALEEAQEAAKEQAPEGFMQAMVVAANNTEPEAAGISTTARVMFEVTDPNAVPRHYCSPDEKKLRVAIKTLDDQKIEIKIPGVRIWHETGIIARGPRK